MFAVKIYSDANKPEEEILSQTLGYVLGQEYFLTIIEENYPELELEVKKARLNFNSSFGRAHKNIEDKLKNILGDYFNSYQSEISKQFAEIIENQSHNKDTAINFLQKVNERAKGDIESPIKETLLTYEYINEPHKELLNNYTKTYRTKDHPKAKGIDFQINIPQSWSQKEGERPNIVQKFRSENGKGLVSVMLLVNDFPLESDYKITDKELDELFSYDGLKEFVPERGRYISGKPIIIDSFKGGLLEFEQTVERLDMQIKIRGINFITLIDNKMIFVQCMLSGFPGKNNLNDERDKFQTLFRLIGNSIIIQNQYKTYNPKTENNSEFNYQKEIAQKKMNEGFGRIALFVFITFFYSIYKIIQWFTIRKKISNKITLKAKNNLKKLGKYAIIWSVIQMLFSFFFILSWGVTSLIFMLIISSLVGFAGYKLYKKESNSFKPIISIFAITSFFSFIIPVIATIVLIQDETTLGEIGFLWLKLFNMIQIIRFGPALLTLVLCFFSISSIFSYLIINKGVNENAHNKRVSG